MKRNIRITIWCGVIGCIFMICILLNYMLRFGTRSGYRIGATYMTMNNPFYSVIDEELQLMIESKGDMLLTRDPALSQEKQNEQIHELLAQGIDILVVNPADFKEIEPALREAKDAGVPVVVVDSQVSQPGLVACTIVSDNYGAGAALSVIILVVCVVRELKNQVGKQWDGVITDKYTKEHYSKDDHESLRSKTTYYYIKVRRDDGKMLTSRLDYEAMYEYLNVNDRIRFHPKLNNYYEKYDKSQDTFLLCPACMTKNDPRNDRCEHCNVPLLK